MKRLAPAAALLCCLPAYAIEPLPQETMEQQPEFKVEVLQVTDIEPYQEAYAGFIGALRAQQIETGRNLRVNRVKVDFDVERGGFWSKLGVVMRIRQEAQRIAAAKPDLVLAIGTPATKYARGILEDAKVPLVFTAVANPLDAGCASLADCGPGVTGSTLYTNMGDALAMVRRVFPDARRIGMVHTDDENGVANVAAAAGSAPSLGMAVTARQVAKTDSIVPSLKALHQQGQGVQLFAVPLDTYYGLHRYEAANDLGDFSVENQVPVVTLAMVRVPGAALYIGAEFGKVGAMAGIQAAKILKHHVKPDVLPVLRQDKPTVLADPARLAALNVTLPATVAAGKTQAGNGFWQLEWTPTP
ncbi:ABC transporter substrate-binding protein [Massilia sp. Root418]|uniref:ABC transporter substrate-binding protein n=1 Tax=Massilia sp. Root418 TaxID=1736532 RepID=UPI000B1BD8CD|nr:ABC transporter substrate binding protein [Massilia sp. Root418]